ncbi:MAG: ABC transporter permease, partial [Candidatus Aminicenantes bacterium]|nr:ABC transporter permease [Candidatus Aminicenantes bacterium]
NSVSWEGKNPDTNIPFYPVPVDENYLETFHIGMAEGRYFYADRTVDQTEAVVINETAARAMGFDSPVGKRMTIATLNSQGSFEERTYTIIGVMKNFHQGSFHNPIEPMFFTMRGDQYPWMNLRISAENMEETLSFMEKTWKSLVPIYPFRYTFIDDTFDGFYKQERRTRSALGMFTVLALFTACLGLFGLASYITERRTKEIGIRKVVGASVGRLVLLQTREFIVWVLAANVIAWPAAYFAVGQWLRGFAFHMRPGINPAVLALAFSVTVSLLAVGYRAVRSALTNPAESLKYE